jgi:hypothetical protein
MIRTLIFLLAAAFVAPAFADEPVIDQSRGADQGIEYVTLTKFGPWDDRNYDLVREDLKYLPPNDRFIEGVPAFFKILKRKELIAEGTPLLQDLYPRELDKEFEYRFGGLLQNGVLLRRGLGKYSHPDPEDPPPPQVYADRALPWAVPILGQGPLGLPSNNETAIEYSPTDPQRVVAGSNGSGGQRMHYSSDGGVTWLSAGALANTCCDPAMDWSPDGATAYAVSLGSGFGSGFRTVFYRSTNFGATWTGPVQVSFGSSDKEYIHVDKHATSPHRGNIYITWHQGNVMFFARSTDGGTTFTNPPLSFPSAERGIGSDITTDKLGNVYHFFPSITSGSAEMYVLKSTDGGATFGAPVLVYDLRGRFDFAVPSMESRRAFIYAAADVDLTNGPRANRIYVAFTDEAPNSPGGGTGSAAATHGWVQVAYSDDAGATWQVAATPHPIADQATVDRYHPWLDVDASGAVHLAFYDTRHSPDRTGVDFYYVLSLDGGATWIEETRVTPSTSVNITNGQEWGDYNGLSVDAASAVGMTWTDNRVPSGGSTPVQNSYAARVLNVAAGPTYGMVNPTSALSVCAGSPVPAIPVQLTAYSGFSSPVTLSTPGLNTTVFPTAAFTVNPVTPSPAGVSSTLNATTAAGSAPGAYAITIRGSGGSGTPVEREVVTNVRLNGATPVVVAPSAPADGATAQPRRPTFTWAAVADTNDYRFELSTTSDFATLVVGTTLSGTTYTPTVDLDNDTQYFWRVRAQNACGNGQFSPVRSLRVVLAPGACGEGSAANTSALNATFDASAEGWANVASGTGTASWSLSTARPFGGTGSSWLAVDVDVTSEQWLVSPPVTLPAGQLPQTLQFQQDRTLETSTSGCWDGGFVEVSTDGTTWTQFTPAQILEEPYTGTLSGGPASGRQAWCGTRPYARTIIDIGTYAGQTVRFRFRVSTDGSVGNAPHGWYIDNVKVQTCADINQVFSNGFEP